MTGKFGDAADSSKRGATSDNRRGDATYVSAHGASLQAHSRDGAYVNRVSQIAPRGVVRVFCDIPNGLAVTGIEVDLCETYLSTLIAGIIANDNDEGNAL
jgi:hypothetical protein